MKNNHENLRAGLFVVIGVLLLLVMLFILGLSDLFRDKAYLRTCFSESVQGLNRGSPVKYRGVQIGTVSHIIILVKQRLVQVDIEIEPRFFADHKFNMKNSDQQFRDFCQQEIRQKGLRARLELVGITGMKFIDFDYYGKPDSKYPTPEFVGNPDALYIPAVPSSLKDLTASLTLALERISRIRFEEISNDLEQALEGVSALLTDPLIKSTMARVNDAAENLENSTRAVNSVVNEANLSKLSSLLERNLRGLDALRQELTRQTLAAKIPESTASFRRGTQAVVELRGELSNTLLKLNQMLEALTTLTDYLSTDPTALLNGKKKPQVSER